MNIDDVGYFRYLIDKIVEDYKVDPDRVYVVG